MNDQDILNFWFSPEHRSLWFAKSDDFDKKSVINLHMFIGRQLEQNFGLGGKPQKVVLQRLLC